MSSQPDIERIEIDLLLNAVLLRYGYDFRHYARASLKRRLIHRLNLTDLNHLSEMIPKILHDPEFFSRLLLDLSITVTEMFRDPDFYAALRERVIPALRTYPLLKIWHAGCATGEEVYSMAILLQEERLYDRTHIYATDFNNRSLNIARQGIYPLARVREGTANYANAGGRQGFSDYYRAQYGSAKMVEELKRNITFANHNLVTDGAFGEMNLILCRNVLIYFDDVLKDRVLTLFCDSLHPLGFLCLGSKESLNFTTVGNRFEAVAHRQRIFRHKVDGCRPAPLKASLA